MEGFDDLVSDHSDNEEVYYSDQIDSDIEAELYGLIHHDPQDDCTPLQDQPDSVEVESVSLQDKSSSTVNNSVCFQNQLDSTEKNLLSPLTNYVNCVNTVNSTKNKKNSVKKSSTPVRTNNTGAFSSDAIVSSNLYYSFESPIQKKKAQHIEVQGENLKKIISPPSKRKSEVVSEILKNIQSKKIIKTAHPESSGTKQKKYNRNSATNETESFVEVLDNSSDSDSNSSILVLEPDNSNLQTNITKETVELSSDSEDSDSSMEKGFTNACKRSQVEISDANISNNKDPWHINSDDKFRTKRNSNRYHESAFLTCCKCKLKGHSAKFCSVPKSLKCFFCGDFHSGQNCKNKICTKCFRLGHDRRHCYIHRIDTCELCKMRGHSERNCPDLWRRYHLTTSKGSIVKGNFNPHSPLFCFNCGTKGHYGAECMENRLDRWNFPTWTSVISYKKPVDIIREENSKRKFQYEPNLYDKRSKFNGTPRFHRRKENEAFSMSTPVQNKKKKKKKKSMTPPSANHQSTPLGRNIVQKEVYFPRTPKVTPSSSTKRFPKSKLKGKEKVLEQQRLHRIGLQQRLGLPFPSTI